MWQKQVTGTSQCHDRELGGTTQGKECLPNWRSSRNGPAVGSPSKTRHREQHMQSNESKRERGICLEHWTVNSMCQLDWAMGCQACDQMLLWEFLWGCFWIRSTFELINLAKHIVLSHVGGVHPIKWRPEQNQEAVSEGILPSVLHGLEYSSLGLELTPF